MDLVSIKRHSDSPIFFPYNITSAEFSFTSSVADIAARKFATFPSGILRSGIPDIVNVIEDTSGATVSAFPVRNRQIGPSVDPAAFVAMICQ